MTESTRKLAAILAADVVGYSRLIAEDEARTLDALRALRRESFEPLVAEHRGEVVKRMGDGWLVAFASVVDAAQCAIQVQERLSGHDRIKLRIGVHLGDIVHEDEDIYGDGVNIAARLQEVAEPGGILISGTAYESVIGRLDHSFEDAGEQRLKNIARSIRGWRWQASPLEPNGLAAPFQSNELADVEQTRPSLAVLPFTNLSSDPEQEFFADGMTEDVINALSKFRWLFVIARGTMFTFKDRQASTSQVADDLGVRYVVEGSIRKAGNRVRVSVQLIDTATDTPFWSERYDRDLDDIFDVQDEVTMAIVTAIEPTLSSAERTRARRKAPENLDAWELYQRGLWHKYRFTADDNHQAISFVVVQTSSDSRRFLERCLSDQVQAMTFSFQISLPSIMVWIGVLPQQILP
jgi:adenylate cyclase